MRETDIFNDSSLQNDIQDVVAIERGLLERTFPLPDLDAELERITGAKQADTLESGKQQETQGNRTPVLRLVVSAALGAAAMLAVVLAWQWLSPSFFGSNSQSVALNQPDRQGLATLETGEGESMTLTLADGTEVSLNSNSRLEYPHHFQGEERTVRLSGEAFFKVKHDGKHPFIVDAGGIITKDLGTSFNIRTFSANDCRVTLVEGSVMVSRKSGDTKPVVLTPGQEYSLTGETAAPKLQEVNTEETTAWVDGVIYYHDKTLEQVVNDLATIYNKVVEIRRDEVRDIHIDFSTSKGNDLLETVTLLNDLGIAKVRVEREKLIVE